MAINVSIGGPCGIYSRSWNSCWRQLSQLTCTGTGSCQSRQIRTSAVGRRPLIHDLSAIGGLEVRWDESIPHHSSTG